MRRVLASILALAVLACADLPSGVSDVYTTDPAGARPAVTFEDDGEFNFHSSTSCAGSGTSITCYLKLENAGTRTAVGLSVYGYWNADAVCVHSKTGKPGPSKHQPTDNPQLLSANYFPSGGVAVSNGEAEVSNLVLEFPGQANPCASNKGAYTSVQWQSITPSGWLAIAFDLTGLENGYATASENF